MQTVGIGKIILDNNLYKTYNIPHLHCLLIQNEKYCEVLNLEFGLSVSRNSFDDAMKDMSENLIDFIERNITAGGFKTLRLQALDKTMDDYWREYRNVEFSLAEIKRDLSHYFVETLKDEITSELLKKYGIQVKAQMTIFEAA